MSKPLFRIEELIEALLKGSPDDPVYLRVGSSTYGIQAIDNGSIRVKSGKNTQDATQVVKTLRRYASGTPKGEDTGISWRIVGVGGGTAIRSVSYDNGKIVVKTLANEGKKMDAEFESPHAGKGSLFKFGGGSGDALGGFTAKELTQSSAIHGDFDHASLNYSGHQNVAARAEESSPDYDASTYDPLSESATPSGYDPVTFEAPKAKTSKKPKKEKTYRQTHDATVSAKIRSLMHEFDRTGMVGRSKPANRKAALDQAVAVAYSMTAATYRKSGKRLPKGVKRAEGEHSHPFDAPMGYNPEGSRPFYGNPRRLARDRWGNLRFIRRRKDGTYMDNVDFGRSIQTDRRMKAKTWAPSGFRDQGDGSLDLLTSLMGAEGDDRDARYQFVVDIYDNDGNECYGAGGYFGGFGSTIQQAADDARKAIIEDMEQEQRRINKAQSRNKAPRAQATRSVAGARFVTVMEFDDDELDYVEIDADLPADIKFNTALAAEGKGREKETKLWVVAAMADELIWSEENQFHTTVRVFDNHINAKKYFNELLLMNGYTGEELDSPEADWDYKSAAIPQPMDDGDELFIEVSIKELSMGYDNGEVYSAETSPDYDASAYDPLSEAASPSGYDPVTFGAESGESVWLVEAAMQGQWMNADAFQNESDARMYFNKWINDEMGGMDLGNIEDYETEVYWTSRYDNGRPSEANQAKMYRVTIQ